MEAAPQNEMEILDRWAALFVKYAVALHEPQDLAQKQRLEEKKPEVIAATLRLQKELSLPDANVFHASLAVHMLQHGGRGVKEATDRLMQEVEQKRSAANFTDEILFGLERLSKQAQALPLDEMAEDAAAYRKATALQDFALGNPRRYVGSLAAVVMAKPEKTL